MSLIISIDPGVNSGVCVFKNGKIADLITLDPRTLILRLEEQCLSDKPDLIVIEDSRMQTTIFQQEAINGNKKTAMSIARKIGSVDAICSIVSDICEKHKCLLISVSPKGKGKKLDSETFKQVTNYEGRTNAHERDACIVGWRYRNKAIS